MSEEDTELGDPMVPTELLELHLELEKAKISPKKFKGVFGNESSNPA